MKRGVAGLFESQWWLLLTMSLFHVPLLLVGIIWGTEGALNFTIEPKSPAYFIKGSDAVLEWAYSEAIKTDLSSIKWTVQNKSDPGTSYTLVLEESDGTVIYNPNMPAAYLNRTEKKEQATLVIKSITYDDATTFSCVLKSKVGSAFDKTGSVQLVVTGPASVQPRIEVFEVGGSATFTCTATSIPSQNFMWTRMKKAGQIENISSDARHTIVSVTGSSQLVIKTITVSDDGYYYVCDATVNAKQKNSASALLQVSTKLTEQDDNSTRDYSVAVGGQLSIHCPVSGHPPPIVTWEKNGTQLLTGVNAILPLNPVKDEDFGKYTCTCIDGITTIGPLTIRVKPILADLAITESTDGTPEEPAKLVWAPQADAENYVVKIINNDYLFDDEFLIGTRTSVEFHYHTLVLKKAESKPEEVDIDVEVTAMSDTRVVAKTPMLQKLTVKLPSDTKN